MKKFWSMLIVLAICSVPAFAQLTAFDSTITNNAGAGITNSVVLDKNKVYLISGFVYVRNGGSITIPAGTILLGEFATKGSLIIERGGKIFANGTATEPIVFTSQFAPGSRNRGDWGGIVICGRAANNKGNFIVEGNIGSIAGYGDGGNVQDDNDNSGVMTYVRIEFPGYPYTANNEINGLTLGAVGRGTTLEHIQVSYSDDDAFEFFGGTVNAKYLIAYKTRDDDFDTDFGYTGKIQFGVSYRDPGKGDVSSSEAFETDNDATGTLATPRTAPIFSNITAVGPKRLLSDAPVTNFDTYFYYGIHHRRSTRHNVFNSVIMGYDEGGIFLDGALGGVLTDTANFTYKNNVFTGFSKLIEPVSYNAWFSSYNNSLLTEPNDVLLKAPFNETSPVLIPQAGSVLLSGASFSDSKLSDPFFTPVSYRGAFSGNGAERWDLGWANYDPQGITYDNPNLVWSSMIYLTSGAGARKSVVIGRGIGATDGIDVSFQESIVPSLPPAGIIDLRSNLGVAGASFIDIRSAASTTSLIVWTLNLQESNPTSVDEVLRWDPNLLGPGAFTLKVLGSPDLDMKANSSAIVASGITTVTIEHDTRIPGTLSYQYGASWNLVSFPGMHPTDMNVNTLWARRDVAFSVFKYSGSYVSVTAAEVGTGYWMNHTAGNAAHLTYTWNTTRLNYAPMKPIKGNAGWNMIGGYEFQHSVDFIRTMPENRKSAASVFRYIPGGGYSAVTSLSPGFGYWLNLTGAADVYLPGAFTGTLAKDPVAEVTKDWGRIVITDAAGQNYILYSADASVDMNMFELPPMPPAGLFDVRFGSQRYAEDLRNSEQTINLNGVVYPVTISAVGMDLRLEDAITGSIVNTKINDGSSYVISNSNVSVLKVGSDKVVPTVYSLEQNYPNPFNPTTTIKFSLPEVSNVKLTIYNALGQKVAELVNSTLEVGSYSFNWDASNVASGLYFYELNTNNFSSVKKMMLMK